MSNGYSGGQSYGNGGGARRHLRSQKHRMVNYNGSKQMSDGYSLNGMRNGKFYNSSSSAFKKFEKKNHWNHRGSGPRKYFF